MPIYFIRNDKLQGRSALRVADVWSGNIKACLRLELFFYMATRNVEVLKQLWCYENIMGPGTWCKRSAPVVQVALLSYTQHKCLFCH